MDLEKTIYKIQYQIAKIEVVELMFLRGKNAQPGLETEMAYNMFFTIRKNLWDISEACLTESIVNSKKSLSALKETLMSASNFLLQTCSGMSSQEPQVLFLVELLTNINTELMKLTGELDKFESIEIKKISSNSKVDEALELLELSMPLGQQHSNGDYAQNSSLKELINMCSGERGTAERLVAHEIKKLPGINRSLAILFAIEHLKDDNR